MKAKLLSLVVFVVLPLLLIIGSAWSDESSQTAEPDSLLYPGATHLFTGAACNKLFQTTMVTSDEFIKVLLFYERVTGEKMRANCVSSKEGAGCMGTVDDSSRPGRKEGSSKSDRPLMMRVLVREFEKDYLSLVVSRAENEDHTHIVLTTINK